MDSGRIHLCISKQYYRKSRACNNYFTRLTNLPLVIMNVPPFDDYRVVNKHKSKIIGRFFKNTRGSTTKCGGCQPPVHTFKNINACFRYVTDKVQNIAKVHIMHSILCTLATLVG
jgi:hypothetical protein